MSDAANVTDNNGDSGLNGKLTATNLMPQKLPLSFFLPYLRVSYYTSLYMKVVYWSECVNKRALSANLSIF